MAITQAFCNIFKSELLKGTHNLDTGGGDTYRIALYTSAATLGAGTEGYTNTNEAAGTGYIAKGEALTLNGVTGGTGSATAFVDFADVTWSTSTITARGALIYNDSTATPGDTADDLALIVLDFGSDKISTAGDFTVQFPAADASNAIIRVA